MRCPRRSAMRSRVIHSSLDQGDAASLADPVHTGGPAPRVDPDRRTLELQQGVELLAGPLALALGLQVGGDRVAQLDEDLDVERGVAQPGLGQGPGRPVDGGVLLGQRQPEVVLDGGAEPDPGQADESRSRARCRRGGRRAARSPRGRAGPGSRREGPTPRRRCRRRPDRGRGRRPGR